MLCQHVYTRLHVHVHRSATYHYSLDLVPRRLGGGGGKGGTRLHIIRVQATDLVCQGLEVGLFACQETLQVLVTASAFEVNMCVCDFMEQIKCNSNITF